MTTFPYGYAGNPQGMGTQLTWPQMEGKQTVSRLHPEFRRRVKALIHAAAEAGVPLGVGTGWRVQPNPPPPGFAKPGNSNHEGFPVGPNSTGAVAADMVPNTGWQWMEDHAPLFGLRTFRYINNEPWHIQPVEIPASRNWRTQPWDLPEFPLPGDVVEPPPVVPEPTPVPPANRATPNVKGNLTSALGEHMFLVHNEHGHVYELKDGKFRHVTNAEYNEALIWFGAPADPNQLSVGVYQAKIDLVNGEAV